MSFNNTKNVIIINLSKYVLVLFNLYLFLIKLFKYNHDIYSKYVNRRM